MIASHAEFYEFGFLGGRDAVIVFFIISGFYMALVLNTNYSDSTSNLRFYGARYSKLILPYIPILIITIALGFLSCSIQYNLVEKLPEIPLWFGVLAVLSNVSLVGQDVFWFLSFDSGGEVVYRPIGEANHNGLSLMLNLPMFTVSIEIFFYLIAPFFLRSFRRSLCLLAIGSCLIVGMPIWIGGSELVWSYHFAPATLFFFSIGALSYRLFILGECYARANYMSILYLLVLIWASSAIFDPILVFLFFLAIPVLFRVSASISIDDLIGQMSYPMYASHYPILMFLKSKGVLAGAELFLWTFCLSLIVALFVNLFFGGLISGVRTKFFGSR